MLFLKVPTNQAPAGNNGVLYGMLYGLIPALFFTAAAFLVCAVLLTYTDISESFIAPFSLAVTIISSFFAGFKTASKADKKGILWGALSVGIYIIIVLLIIMLPYGENMSLFRALSIVLSVVSGAVGGILGINTKK